MCVYHVLSHIRLFASPWTVARQTPLSMGFPRQESQRELPFPSPGDIPDSGIKPASPALAGGFFTTEDVSSRQFCLPCLKKILCKNTYSPNLVTHSTLIYCCQEDKLTLQRQFGSGYFAILFSGIIYSYITTYTCAFIGMFIREEKRREGKNPLISINRILIKQIMAT